MKTSQSGVDLIKSFESLRLEAYLCPAGVRTIGWGHTECVLPGQRITVEQAEDLLRGDIAQVERDLAEVIPASLTQGEHDALASLCFNLRGGARRLPHIAPKLVEKLLAGDRAGASLEFLDINRANGVPMPGLTRRRQAERALFLS